MSTALASCCNTCHPRLLRSNTGRHGQGAPCGFLRLRGGAVSGGTPGSGHGFFCLLRGAAPSLCPARRVCSIHATQTTDHFGPGSGGRLPPLCLPRSRGARALGLCGQHARRRDHRGAGPGRRAGRALPGGMSHFEPPLPARSGGSACRKSSPAAILSARTRFPCACGAAGETCKETLLRKASESTAHVAGFGIQLGGLRPSEPP